MAEGGWKMGVESRERRREGMKSSERTESEGSGIRRVGGR